MAAAHVSPEQAWHMVSAAGRAAMGLDRVVVEPGAPAELLAVRASSLREAIAVGHPDRLVFHRGRLVARTTTDRQFPAAGG